MIVILRKQRGSLRGRKEASMEDREMGIEAGTCAEERVCMEEHGMAW